MSSNNPELSGQIPAPEHPKENKGLVEKLKRMLTGGQSAAETSISEGSRTLDNSAEHQEIVSQLADQRARQEAVGADKAQLRAQALEELGGASGVVSVGPEEVERKIAEIRSRNTPESSVDTPAA